MKWILALLILSALAARPSTFIGNGGQAGDVELAVSLKQLRSAIERIQAILQGDPAKRLCVCPEDYADHNLCEIIEKLNEEQKRYCDKFIVMQLGKLDKAYHATQFEWVETSMLNKNTVGVRVVDAVAQKDKKMIYIDQTRFIDLTPSKRLFLLTHELFHMDKFENSILNDENKIGPFTSEYGVRDLLNAAAAGIVLTSIEESVFQNYTKILNQSRSTKKHWFGFVSAANQVKDDKKSNFDTRMDRGYRFSYLFQPESLYNFGLTLQLQTQSGDKNIFESVRLKEKRSSWAIGVSYRRFLFNDWDPINHFWNLFLQLELLHERLDGNFDLSDNYTSQQATASSTSPALRISLYIPIKLNFWINVGAEMSQHKLYYQEFDYNLVQNTPSYFLGVSYGL